METKMNISDLVWDEKIYPREKTNEKTIDAYCEALDAGAQFPPIEIQRVRNYPEREGEIFIILDGVHRYDAYRRGKVEEVEVKEWRPETIDYKENQIILLLEAAERNRNHGDRLTENDKKGVARSIAEGDPKRTFTEKQIADKLVVIQETVSNWISDIRARQRAGRNAKIIHLSRLGLTQEEIAEVVGKDRSVISRKGVSISLALFSRTRSLLLPPDYSSIGYRRKQYSLL